MSSCELCGSSSNELKKVKIEGSRLKVCDSCSELGEEVKSSGKKKRKKKKSRKRRSRSQDKVLVPDYGQKVKEARESEGMTIQELSNELNEKESVISKIEKEQFKPGKSLGKSLSKKLGVSLYTTPGVTSPSSTDNVDSRKATMEDVADIN